MVVPDFELICEIMLVAEGFLDARLLARKFITLYTLCKELLSKQVCAGVLRGPRGRGAWGLGCRWPRLPPRPARGRLHTHRQAAGLGPGPAREDMFTPGACALCPQDHYDWGLRAIKSVLVVAGSLKRGDPSRAEDQVLMRALRDFNIPKIVTDDLPVFMGLIGDLFPALDVPRKRDLNFEKVGAAGPGASPGARHTHRRSGSALGRGALSAGPRQSRTRGQLPPLPGEPRGRQLPLRPWPAPSQCWGASRRT